MCVLGGVPSAAFRIPTERRLETWSGLGATSSTHLYFQSSKQEPGEGDSGLSQSLFNTEA